MVGPTVNDTENADIASEQFYTLRDKNGDPYELVDTEPVQKKPVVSKDELDALLVTVIESIESLRTAIDSIGDLEIFTLKPRGLLYGDDEEGEEAKEPGIVSKHIPPFRSI